MAIDYDVARTMDQFRGNPAALQQRYSSNRDLIDLLALQKLKSEKEQAVREMHMQAQTQPTTIKEQREAELHQMNVREMAEQVGATNQVAMARAQQQAMAPQTRTQAGSGIASVAPNVQNFAKGGIVAFAEGGEVTQDMIDDQFAEAPRRAWRGILDLLARHSEGAEADRERGKERGRESRARMDPPAPLRNRESRDGGTYDDVRAMLESGRIPPGPVTIDSEPESVAFEDVPRGTSGPSVSRESSFGDEVRSGILSQLRRDPTADANDMAAMMRGAMAGTQSDVNRQRQAAQDMQGIMATINDPDKLRRQQLIASLIGAGNRSTFASGMQGSAAAGMNERERQETERLAQQQRLADQLSAVTTAQAGVDSTSANAMGRAVDNAEAARRTAMNAGSAMENARVNANATAQIRSDIKNMELMSRLASQSADIQERIVEAVNNDQRYAMLQLQLIDEDASEEERNLARQGIEALYAEYAARYADTTDSINALMRQLGGGEGSTGLPPGVTVREISP